MQSTAPANSKQMVDDFYTEQHRCCRKAEERGADENHEMMFSLETRSSGFLKRHPFICGEQPSES